MGIARRAHSAGCGGAGCYAAFKKEQVPNAAWTIESCNIKVEVSPDYQDATYSHEYRVRWDAGESSSDWYHVVPYPVSQLDVLNVHDADGGLQYVVSEHGREHSRIDIDLRDPDPSRVYSFGFSYRTKIISIGAHSRTIAYHDWIIFDAECNKVEFEVVLPSGSKIYETVPPADSSADHVSFASPPLRPLEYYSFLVGIRSRRRLQRDAKLTLASLAAGSAVTIAATLAVM